LITGSLINGLPNGFDSSVGLSPDHSFTVFNPATFPAGATATLVPGETYMYRVRCGCLVNNTLPLPDRLESANLVLSPWSEFEFFVNLEAPTNEFVTEQSFFKSTEQNNDLSIYPNPNDGAFNLNLSNVEDQIRSIEVLNISGQVVLQIPQNGSNIIRVDASNLQSGIYLVKIETSSDRILEKFVKE